MPDLTQDQLRAQQVAAKQQTDFDDLQHEIVGRDVGKIARFLSGENALTPEAKRKLREKEAEQRLLIELLADPAYAKLYHELGERLSEAETQTDMTIAQIEADLRQIDVDIAQMETNAARGPNGELVFRYADGRVVNAQNEEIPPEIAAGIEWPDTEPSAEDYFAARAMRETLVETLQDWNVYRTDVLGGIRDRHSDEDAPMMKEDMTQALEEIQRLSPNTVSLQNAPLVIAAKTIAPATQISVPMALK